MNISIDKNHTVHILSMYPGPYLVLDLSARDALTLLQGLEQKKAQITDLATNYYSCPECAEDHHVSVKVCPTLQ